MSTELDWLRERLEAAMTGLPKVERKRMFGCDAFFKDGTIFALIWKEGRIGVKLPDESAYASLAKVKGAEPWSPGGKMVMGSWLLVPASWNEDDDKLRPWVEKAHTLAVGKTAPKPKKKAAKKKKAR